MITNITELESYFKMFKMKDTDTCIIQVIQLTVRMAASEHEPHHKNLLKQIRTFTYFIKTFIDSSLLVNK